MATPDKREFAGEAGRPRGQAHERRAVPRYPCRRLVVIRLPGGDGTWRWYWVTDISARGVGVSFLINPNCQGPLETTLLDVDGANSFSVTVRCAWYQDGSPTRTGFEFVRADPALEAWLRRLTVERHSRSKPGGPTLWKEAEADAPVASEADDTPAEKAGVSR